MWPLEYNERVSDAFTMCFDLSRCIVLRILTVSVVIFTWNSHLMVFATSWGFTVWKIKAFYTTQILREINFGQKLPIWSNSAFCWFYLGEAKFKVYTMAFFDAKSSPNTFHEKKWGRKILTFPHCVAQVALSFQKYD